jgi:crossover junction endodeoxyribonuclease RuvC
MTRASMRILGVDPGLRITGYGVIEKQGDRLIYVTSGRVKTLGAGLPDRIRTILDGLAEVIACNGPQQVAIEKVFVNVNPQSTLLLGQARGACLTALVTSNLSVAEYTALQMKQAVAGHGKAAKAQVQEMVKRLLQLPGLPGSDAADALGIAITHAHVGSSMARLGQAAVLSRSTSGMYRQGRTR